MNDTASPKADPAPYLDTVLSIWAERHARTRCHLSGRSMAPLLEEGDVLIVEHGARDLRIGDVIVFRAAGRLKAHRLLWRRKDGSGRVLYVAKGDASRVPDAPLTEGKIIGKVVEARGRFGLLRLTSPFWAVANLAIAMASAGQLILIRALSVPERLARKARSLHLLRWRGTR